MFKGTLIYDTNNWLRVKLSTDGDETTISNFWAEVLYKSYEGYIQIFVSDGRDSRRKRRSIYPEYKAKRKPADVSIYDGINLFKNFLIHAPQNVFRCELKYTEADDIIASLIKKREDVGICGPVEIMSTDKDLTQILSFGFDDVKVLANLPKDIEPEWVHLYKTLVGDSSDNIPGVQGLGPGAFMKIPENVRYSLCKCLSSGNSLEPWAEEWFSNNLTPKMKENFFECFYNGTMSLFWEITGFYDIPIEEIKLIPGDGDISMVTKEMNNLFII